MLSEGNKEISIPELSEKALIAPTEPFFCDKQFPLFKKHGRKMVKKTVTALCNFPHFALPSPGLSADDSRNAVQNTAFAHFSGDFQASRSPSERELPGSQQPDGHDRQLNKEICSLQIRNKKPVIQVFGNNRRSCDLM
jgi:hypothetical protein